MQKIVLKPLKHNSVGQRTYQPRQYGPITLDFPDYKGEKVHEMPDDYVQFLTKPDPSQIISTSESDVGITEFRNPEFSGFDAIIKHRFSDFNVNEIDLKGNVVRLTELGIPQSVAKVYNL